MEDLVSKYMELCNTPSDINEHLPTLFKLAREANHITEMWVRTWVSTVALLAGIKQDAKMISYDKDRHPQITDIKKLANDAGKSRTFENRDVLEVEIEPTDILFIDTRHVKPQLEKELALHSSKVKKYIAMHDTTTFAEKGETEWHEWLRPAVEGFLKNNPERSIRERFTNNNWLTILQRC